MKVMTIFGTRPEGIKMAPLVQAMKNDAAFDVIVVNTAQHREQLDQVLTSFQIEPDYDLNIMKLQQTPTSITSSIMDNLSPIMQSEKPDLVMVHGDTTTTFAGAYVAFLNQIPIAHIEAGLRSYKMYEPFPEEKNRELVGHLASYHLAATERNRENLMKENITDTNICVVGNTAIDSLMQVINQDFIFPEEIQKLVDSPNKLVVLTSHRRENVTQLNGLSGIFEAINQLIERHDDIEIVFPVHRNPEVRLQVRKYLNESNRIHLVEPLNYEIFANLMSHSHLIITDSGGIQEEAPALNVPVLVARNTTERQEGVEAGTLKLVGTDSEKIFYEADRLLKDEHAYKSMADAKNPYGDGTSCKKIIQFLKTNFSSEK